MTEFEYSTRNPDHPVAYSKVMAMHTVCEMLIPHCPEDEARSLMEECWDAVEAVSRRYNRFDPGSELSGVNARAGSGEVVVGDEMFLALHLCESFRAATGGYFDVSAASRLAPGKRARWLLDDGRRSVRFSDRGVRLDLGGFAKGFALDKVHKLLEGKVESAIVSFGGSSTLALGSHPLGGPWRVSVAHEYYPGKVAGTFPLEDSSLSVSGKDPRGRGHIMDPFTGNIVEKDGLVAVQGPSPLVCEVLSTALWVAPSEARKDILPSFEGYEAWEISCLAGGGSRKVKI